MKIKRHTQKQADRYADWVLQKIEYAMKNLDLSYDTFRDEYLSIMEGEEECINAIEQCGCIGGQNAKCPWEQIELVPLSELR